MTIWVPSRGGDRTKVGSVASRVTTALCTDYFGSAVLVWCLSVVEGTWGRSEASNRRKRSEQSSAAVSLSATGRSYFRSKLMGSDWPGWTSAVSVDLARVEYWAGRTTLGGGIGSPSFQPAGGFTPMEIATA